MATKTRSEQAAAQVETSVESGTRAFACQLSQQDVNQTLRRAKNLSGRSMAY